MAEVKAGSNEYEQSQSSGPWAPWQVPAQNIYDQAKRLFQPGNLPQYFQGDTTAAFNPMQTQANQQLFNQAIGGGQINPTAANYFKQMLGGPQMNPYVGQMADRIKRDFSETVIPGLDAKFRGANAGGGSAHALATGRAATGLGDALANMYGRAYESEQGRKMQALGLAPALQQSQFAPYMLARGAGDYQQQQQQREIDAAVAKHNYVSGGGQADWLTQYANMILGHPVNVSSGKSSGSQMTAGFGT